MIVKQILRDWGRLYTRHFLEWNIVKMGAFFVGCTVTILALVILLIPMLFFFSREALEFLNARISDSLTPADIRTLAAGIGVHFLVFLVYIVGTFIVIGGVFFYHYMMVIRLNISYMRHETMKFWNRDFFSWRNFWKFLKVFWLTVLLLLLLLGVLMTLMSAVINLLWGHPMLAPNAGVVTLFVGILLLLGYIGYRFCFAWYIVGDTKHFPNTGAIEAFTTSWKLTKGSSLIAYIALVIVLSIFLMIYWMIAITELYLDFSRVGGAHIGIWMLYGSILLVSGAYALYTKKISFFLKGLLLLILLHFTKMVYMIANIILVGGWAEALGTAGILILSYDVILTFLASIYISLPGVTQEKKIQNTPVSESRFLDQLKNENTPEKTSPETDTSPEKVTKTTKNTSQNKKDTQQNTKKSPKKSRKK